MTSSSTRTWLVSALLAATLAMLLAGQRTNPPGYFVDEVSISWNALMMARHGVDEYGARFPIFFRANPVYNYTLAAVFLLVPPSDVAGRHLSAILDWLASMIAGWLAWRISGRLWIGVASFLTLVCTPVLFEISRLVLEAAMYPLVVALFLVAAWQASRRERWGAGVVAALVVTLILLTYTYSIGRLFGPLMAAGLLIFATRPRLRGLVAVLLLYGAAAALPLIVYKGNAADPLMARFNALRSYRMQHGWERPYAVAEYLADNLDPVALSTEGDSIVRHHVPGSGGSILVMTVLLAILGGIVVAIMRRERWWIFIVYGAFISFVPVSLTYDVRHALRSTPIPVFLVLLSIPALELLAIRSRIVAAFFAAGAIQVVWFFAMFLTAGPKRPPMGAAITAIVRQRIAMPQRPIWILENGREAYDYGCWYGAQAGVPPGDFVPVTDPSRLPPHVFVIVQRDGDYNIVRTP